MRCAFQEFIRHIHQISDIMGSIVVLCQCARESQIIRAIARRMLFLVDLQLRGSCGLLGMRANVFLLENFAQNNTAVCQIHRPRSRAHREQHGVAVCA